ncbi:hypothetical protein NL30_04905 [Burkholderia contaminans]|uniref:hypothetical protein n=1 Tax=Burkholderia contaminans TaxID=488447 RepID=UPI000649FAFB|nr:hypothetical protein [Burkholderia contaminans]AKM39274.1 hypothetical protein NL30_04905 [Burkholderia contaminans]
MTRIGPHSAALAQQAAAAHRKSAKPSRTKPAGQFATLYRGTRFAHGGMQAQQNAAQMQRAKKMAARLARRRRTARGKRGAGSLDGADGADTAGEPPELEVSGDEHERRGGNGGGRDSQGDEQDDTNETERVATATFKTGRRPTAGPAASTRAAESPPAPAPGLDPRALRDACARELLALPREFAAQPGAGVAAHVHAWSARWLRVQQSGVALPEADLEMLRTQPPPQRGAVPLPEAARDLNVLAGLLLRQFDRPRTPRQSVDALDTLRALRRMP